MYPINILQRIIFAKCLATLWEVRVEAGKPGRSLLPLVKRLRVCQARKLEIEICADW